MHRYKISEFIVKEDTEEEPDLDFIKECITESFSDNDIEIEGALEVTKIE